MDQLIRSNGQVFTAEAATSSDFFSPAGEVNSCTAAVDGATAKVYLDLVGVPKYCVRGLLVLCGLYSFGAISLGTRKDWYSGRLAIWSYRNMCRHPSASRGVGRGATDTWPTF